MKKLLTAFVLLLIFHPSFAQWSNTTNNFTDSLHMPVVTATSTQQYPMVINSYPDGGTIVYWEDERASSTNKKDIYAQKYDKTGKKLWGANGKPVANGTNNEHFYSSQNTDYRNYSYACTDSANGFYICYVDDSIATYDWQRILIQHIKSDGSKVFAKGYIVAQTPSGSTINFSYPQLIADGNDGCFVSYVENYGTTNEPNIYCYKDINGVMKNYGGGFVVRYYTNIDNECPSQLHNIPLVIQDYMIYPNLQNGCNIVASVNGGTGNETYFTAFNSVVRVKKNITVKVDNSTSISYKKDSVLVYYQPSWHTVNVTCPGGGVGTAYIVDGFGFGGTGIGGLNTAYSKGVAIKTDGNIVANVVAAANRRYINNAVTNWATQLGVVTSEVYDAVPYSFTVAPYHTNFFNDGKPGRDSIVGNKTDTVFYNSSPYSYEFAEQVANNKVYFASKTYHDGFTSNIALQTFQFSKKQAHQYQLTYLTPNHNGVQIGNEVSTGFTGTDISYNNPQLAVDFLGHILFYINERAPRVSPITSNTQLLWGAMGRRIGSGTTPSGYYSPDMPFAVLKPAGGVGFISMTESRPENNTGMDVYGRHLDSLLKAGYAPPLKPVKDLIGGNLQALPECMVGSSKVYSLVEILNYNNGVFGDNSPMLQILDNKNFGTIQTALFQNKSTIRLYNSKPYLDRNYNIVPSATIGASASVNIRFFFSTNDFNALKAADPSVTNPSKLTVIKQTAPYNSAPSTYAPVSGEVKLAVQSWKAVSGGYYIEFAATKFSGFNNYYIFPTDNTPSAFTAANAIKPSLSNNLFIEKVYPTVINGDNTLFIKAGNKKVSTMLVEIFSLDGKELYQQRKAYQSQTIQMPTLAAGMYAIKITSGNLAFYSTVIKQ